jgi:ketosteroid isomerase-like protein
MLRHHLGVIVGCAITAASAVAADGGAQPSASVEKEVLAVEQAWVEAERKGDTDALKRLIHDRYIVTFNTGKLHNKEEFIKAFAGSKPEQTRQTLSDETVIVDHDTAIVVGTDTLQGTKNGEPYTRVARYTCTYVRRDGHWVALAEHLVDVPHAVDGPQGK